MYTAISIVLIWVNVADMAVFGLNTVCLFRALIHNTVSASEITDSRNIADKCGRHSHYHVKAGMLFMAAFIFGVAWMTLNIEKSKDVDILVKLFASFAISAVCIDDCEYMIVYAYDAAVQ